MKFLIVEPSTLPILIPLGPKYLPQDPVVIDPYPAFLLQDITYLSISHTSMRI